MIIYPLLSGTSWVLQSFFDKELLKFINLYSYLLIKSFIGFLILILLLYLFKLHNLSSFYQDIQKIKKNQEVFKKLVFVSLVGLGSAYFHYVGYTKFKITNFVSLETLFSIIISALLGYFFFNEKLKKNEIIGIFLSILSISVFYIDDLNKLFKK